MPILTPETVLPKAVTFYIIYQMKKTLLLAQAYAEVSCFVHFWGHTTHH